MINVRIEKHAATSWWAAIGAPLIGVPLLIALLSLAAPKSAAGVAKPEVGQATEQLEVTTVGIDANEQAPYIEQLFHSC
jgi:uncharacterized protein (UPF0212 family)